MRAQRYRVGIGLATCACMVTLLAGCGAAGGSTTSTSTDGATLVNELCSRCHPQSRVDGAKKDRTGWTTSVERMMSHGLSVSDAQKQAIIDYLTKRDGGQ